MKSAVVCNGQIRIFENGEAYRISKFGKESKIVFSSKTYYAVSFVDEYGVRRKSTIHRLVADSFVPNSNNYPYVNHIDGDKHNNSAENLEWVTPRENVVLAYCMGQMANKRNRSTNIKRYSKIVEKRYGKTIRDILGERA